MNRHIVRGFWWGPSADVHWLQSCPVPVLNPPDYQIIDRDQDETASLEEAQEKLKGGAPVLPDENTPTVLVVHALTGDMRVAGEGGWWADMFGPGRVIDPSRYRILCFNNLGSCYGTSGPSDWESRLDGGVRKNGVLSTWDQARSILLALDAMNVSSVDVLVGGSVGGAIALCLGALAPLRFKKIVAIATAEASSPWVIGWNHIARKAIALDPEEGLKLARELAHLTYRNESGLLQRHGRGFSLETMDRFSPDGALDAAYRMQAYLDHQGVRFLRRFRADSYLALLDSIDHHDLARCPGEPDAAESWQGACTRADSRDLGDVDLTSPHSSWGLARVRAEVFAVAVNSDQLFFPVHSVALVDRLRALGCSAQYREISSIHGHDGFLMDLDQISPVIIEALGI